MLQGCYRVLRSVAGSSAETRQLLTTDRRELKDAESLRAKQSEYAEGGSFIRRDGSGMEPEQILVALAGTPVSAAGGEVAV